MAANIVQTQLGEFYAAGGTKRSRYPTARICRQMVILHDLLQWIPVEL